MKRLTAGLLTLLAAGLLAAAPVSAAKKHSTHPAASTCKQIKDAVASGKSEDDVAKDLKVSPEQVKKCTAPAPAHKKTSKKTM